MGSATAAEVLRGKSGDLGLPKKVLDKGRWSQSVPLVTYRPATRAVSTACRISLPCRPGWSLLGIFKIKVVGRVKKFGVPKRLRRVGLEL